MADKTYGKLYRFSRGVVRFLIPRYTVDPLPETDEATVYVSHHQNMIGPVSVLAWIDQPVRPWVFSVFTDQKECFDQYVGYTFTKRFGLPKLLAKAAAWPISHYISGLMNAGRAIPVYRRSKKVMRTMKMSVEALQAGERLLIFPDVDYTNASQEVGEIYEGFLFLDKYYHKKTGRHISFVPLYSDKTEKVVRVGNEVRFTDGKEFVEERRQVAERLHAELNRLASLSIKTDHMPTPSA